MWEIDRNCFGKNEVKNLTNFVEVRLFKIFFFFWNYLDINYVFQSICNLWALCGFNTMPCVISRWSSNLVYVVFVTTESNLGQCPFTLDDTFFPTVHGGKRFLDCVWVRLLLMGPRNHMQKRSYLMRSLCCPWGERKTLMVWVRLLSMGPRVCILERIISCQLWMGGSPDRSMW